jgi:hypothetical protein
MALMYQRLDGQRVRIVSLETWLGDYSRHCDKLWHE